MVLINEWLANPTGSDLENEWVEIFNTGPKSEDLRGWQIENGSGKKHQIDLTIKNREYAIIKRNDFKIALRNQNETISLLDKAGRLVDKSSYLGSIPEGRSVARIGQQFILADPTPGAENLISEIKTFAELPPKIIKNDPNILQVAGMAIFLGVMISLGIIFLIKKNDEASKLFFGKN